MASSVAHASDPAGPSAGEVRKLSTLLEVSQALLAARELKAGLVRVLEILGDHHGAVRSTVVLLDERTGDVAVEASAGAIDSDKPVRYRLGEGITGEVVAERHADGRAASQPRATVPQSRRQRGRSWREQELTYISRADPPRRNKPSAPSASISIYKPDRDYERTTKFLGVVGSMIAQAMKVHQLIEADRQLLVTRTRTCGSS